MTVKRLREWLGGVPDDTIIATLRNNDCVEVLEEDIEVVKAEDQRILMKNGFLSIHRNKQYPAEWRSKFVGAFLIKS